MLAFPSIFLRIFQLPFLLKTVNIENIKNTEHKRVSTTIKNQKFGAKADLEFACEAQVCKQTKTSTGLTREQ